MIHKSVIDIRTKRAEGICALRSFGIRICAAGLEQGGGEAVSNSPVDCCSARGKVLYTCCCNPCAGRL